MLSIFTFGRLFYSVKVNRYGTDSSRRADLLERATRNIAFTLTKVISSIVGVRDSQADKPEADVTPYRRKVLIATLEYEILGWDLKVR
jgi:hypothetical protein